VPAVRVLARALTPAVALALMLPLTPADLAPPAAAASGSPPRPSARTAELPPAEVAAAARRVAAVWGPWRGGPPVVLAVPDTAALARATGRDAADTAGLVAIAVPGRVYVDLDAYLALPRAGRSVLLTHELTHLATGAPDDAGVPLWLEEGFADYVGFAGSGIPVGRAAVTLLADVRAGRTPSALPAAGDFAPSAGVRRQADAYAGAWLFCRLVADRDGTAALVATYRLTSAGSGLPAERVDAALRRTTEHALRWWVARWRVELVRLAR